MFSYRKKWIREYKKKCSTQAYTSEERKQTSKYEKHAKYTTC